MIGYLENGIDAVVVRHSNIRIVKSMAEHARIPVFYAICWIRNDINFLTGAVWDK